MGRIIAMVLLMAVTSADASHARMNSYAGAPSRDAGTSARAFISLLILACCGGGQKGRERESNVR